MNVRLARVLLGFFFWCCLLVGCGGTYQGGGKTELAADERHILKLSTLWMDYKGTHKGKAPESAEELKKYAKTLKPEKLKQIGIEDVDKAFISPRDNQPYKLAKVSTEHGGMTRVLVYEQTGVGGVRKVASSMGNISEMSDEELRQHLPNP